MANETLTEYVKNGCRRAVLRDPVSGQLSVVCFTHRSQIPAHLAYGPGAERLPTETWFVLDGRTVRLAWSENGGVYIVIWSPN